MGADPSEPAGSTAPDHGPRESALASRAQGRTAWAHWLLIDRWLVGAMTAEVRGHRAR